MATIDDYKNEVRRMCEASHYLRDCYVVVPHQLPPEIKWASSSPPDKESEMPDRYVEDDHDAHSTWHVSEAVFLTSGHQWLKAKVLAEKTLKEDDAWFMERALCEAFACNRLDDAEFQRLADPLTWDNVYPVVDAGMHLTGEISEADERMLNYDDRAVIDEDDAREAGWVVDSDDGSASPPKEVPHG